MSIRENLKAGLPGSYRVKMANGGAFEVLNFNTKIHIEEAADDAVNPYRVTLAESNQAEDDARPMPARIDDWGNLRVSLSPQADGKSTEAILCLWVWQPGTKNEEKHLFGEIYVGDPDTAGGFGGEGDPPPEPEEG